MAQGVKDGIGEIVTAGKEQVVSRLSNPVVGPFLLSWALCNYRVFFTLFSGESLKDRFAAVDRLTAPLTDYLLGPGLLTPLVITLGYIFVVPVVVEGVLRWNLKMGRRQKAAEQRSEGLELLTKDESKYLRALRVEKDRQVRELQELLKVERANLTGWRAMVKGAAPNAGGSSDQSLISFLLSQEFEVFEANSVSRPIASLFLYEGGTAHGEDIMVGYSRHIDRWSVTNGSLTFRDGKGNVTGRLSFLPDRGVVLGKIQNDSVELRGKLFQRD